MCRVAMLCFVCVCVDRFARGPDRGMFHSLIWDGERCYSNECCCEWARCKVVCLWSLWVPLLPTAFILWFRSNYLHVYKCRCRRACLAHTEINWLHKWIDKYHVTVAVTLTFELVDRKYLSVVRWIIDGMIYRHLYSGDAESIHLLHVTVIVFIEFTNTERPVFYCWFCLTGMSLPHGSQSKWKFIDRK